ncbi:MAG: pyruvate kinase [Gammaproteobacteria bacterium]|nr:MAG: pyruvate kinase [Gammaproteobacteria bacterium]
MRRTKIIATLGPASNNEEVLSAMIDAGVDVVRLNFSHGSHESHINRANMVRKIAAIKNKTVGILVDLQGPKIRITKFKKGQVNLIAGDYFTLNGDLPVDDGDEKQVGHSFKTLSENIQKDNTIVLDDGRVVLKVIEVIGNKIKCIVTIGGELSDNKGLNKKGGGLKADALSAKDKEDMKIAAQINADFVAVSFVRDASDIKTTRKILKKLDCYACIVAKIERSEALDNIDEIMQATDIIMIARGDLGVEIGDAELPSVQKRLIHKARCFNKVAITATQMMESMIHNPIPTRAEVFDVANAVLDGTDAVMLSGETAVGCNPARVIAAMSSICKKAENQPKVTKSDHRIGSKFNQIDETIALSAMYAANHLGVAAIVALTESGTTALWMSRISSGRPIYALSHHRQTRRRVTLYRGVYPVDFPCDSINTFEANEKAVEIIKDAGIVEDGDKIIVTKGDLFGTQGGTNVMKILTI